MVEESGHARAGEEAFWFWGGGGLVEVEHLFLSSRMQSTSKQYVRYSSLSEMFCCVGIDVFREGRSGVEDGFTV